MNKQNLLFPIIRVVARGLAVMLVILLERAVEKALVLRFWPSIKTKYAESRALGLSALRPAPPLSLTNVCAYEDHAILEALKPDDSR